MKKKYNRLGDNGEYNHVCNDLDALADVLHEAYLGDNLAQCDGGISTDNYRGWNYISVYWGDAEANLEQQITKTEFRAVCRKLKEKSE